MSTDSEDQQNSFFAQVKYYNDYIRQNENMQLIDIYADEGITGTRAEKTRRVQTNVERCEESKT